MQIRLANAPVSWGIMEVEGWSPSVSAARVLDEIAAAGYEGTELGPYGFLPVDSRELCDELARRRLTLTSAFVPLPLKQPGADLAPLRTVAALLAAAGARHLVLADAMWPERERIAGRAGTTLGDDEWGHVRDNVESAIAAASEYGLRCVFHHHAGTYVETPAEVERLLDSTAVGLCLDTGHYVYGGGDPVEAVRRYGSRVEYLHFKDIDPARISGSGFLNDVRAGVFRPLGQGAVRFPALIEELHRAGFDGWAVVEQDIDGTQAAAGAAFDSAKSSRQYLKEELGI